MPGIRPVFFLAMQILPLLFCKALHAQELSPDKAAKWDDSILTVLHKNVPELTNVMSRFTEHFSTDTSYTNNGDTLSAVEWVEGHYNDPKFKNYPYAIYVGESHSTHTVRWYTFLISENLKKFWYYDIANDKVFPLNHWKKLWPATEFLHHRKK